MKKIILLLTLTAAMSLHSVTTITEKMVIETNPIKKVHDKRIKRVLEALYAGYLPLEPGNKESSSLVEEQVKMIHGYSTAYIIKIALHKGFNVYRDVQKTIMKEENDVYWEMLSNIYLFQRGKQEIVFVVNFEIPLVNEEGNYLLESAFIASSVFGRHKEDYDHAEKTLQPFFDYFLSGAQGNFNP